MPTSSYSDSEGTSRQASVQAVGPFSIELLADETRCFLGLGEIRCQGRLIRGGKLPWQYYAETIGGQAFASWQQVRLKSRDEHLEVRLASTGQANPFGNERNIYHERMATLRTGTQCQPATAELVLEFHAGTWLGLPCLKSRIRLETSEPVDWVLERYSLEINGTTQGNRYFAQRWGSEHGGWQVDLSSPELFSTCDGYTLRGEPRIIGQMTPRLAGGVAMDFLFTDNMAVAAYREEGGLTQSVTTKPEGSEHLEIIEQYWGGRSKVQVTPWLNIGVFAAPEGAKIDEATAHNLWARLWDDFADALNERLGVPRPQPIPAIYCESWNLGSGRFFEYQIAQLDYIQCTGAKRVILHTLPHPHDGSNCCALHDFSILESEGGMEELRRYVNEAHERGLEVYGWATNLLLRKSKLCRQNSSWFNRDAAGQHFGAGYDILGTFDLGHPEAQDYVADWLIRYHKEAGLDGFWIDSFINAYATPVNYERATAVGGPGPILPGAFETLARAHAVGVSFVTEGMSPIATSAGNLCLWENIEGKTSNIMGKKINIGAHGLYRSNLWVRGQAQEAGASVTEDFYFQALANKAPLALMYDTSDYSHITANERSVEDVKTPRYREMNALYLKVVDQMGVRELLPGCRSVLWHPLEARDIDLSAGGPWGQHNKVPGPRILFAYDEEDIELPGKWDSWEARDLERGDVQPLNESGILSALARAIYVLTPSPD